MTTIKDTNHPFQIGAKVLRYRSHHIVSEIPETFVVMRVHKNGTVKIGRPGGPVIDQLYRPYKSGADNSWNLRMTGNHFYNAPIYMLHSDKEMEAVNARVERFGLIGPRRIVEDYISHEVRSRSNMLTADQLARIAAILNERKGG